MKDKMLAEVEQTNSGDDQSNDDSPVSISWKESQNVFIRKEKERKDAVDHVKSKQKERKRKKNEMFVAQKLEKNKLSKTQLTKLPDDIVEAITKTVNQPMEEECAEEISHKPKRKHSKIENSEAPNFVVVLKDDVLKPKEIQASAAKFLKSHMYGKRIQRKPTMKYLSLRSKKRSNKPALKFERK